MELLEKLAPRARGARKVVRKVKRVKEKGSPRVARMITPVERGRRVRPLRKVKVTR